MPKKYNLTVLVLLAGLSTVVNAQPPMGGGDHMMGGMGHGGMEGGHGMMGGHSPGKHMSGELSAVWSVGLDEKQRVAVRKISRELRKTKWEIKGKIADQSDRLWELYDEDNPDAAKIGAVYGKMFDLRRQMIEETIKAQNKVNDLLSDKQRRMLKQRMWRWGWQGQ